MKERKLTGKVAALFLAAVLVAALFPSVVRAEEAGEIDTQQTDNEKDAVDDVQGDKKRPDTGDDKTDGQSGIIPATGMVVTPVIQLMDSTDQYYGSLSQFLSLSADRFQIYTVGFVSMETGQPTPVYDLDAAMEIPLDVPAAYDTSRLVVSEISLSGQTPARTETAYRYENGKAVIKTDHAGMYAVMEKKVMQELPSSLEFTAKIERLELTKKTYIPYNASSGNVNGGDAGSSDTAQSGEQTLSKIRSGETPQTGVDDLGDIAVWGIVAAAAAGAVIAAVVVIWKRRK